MLIVVGTFDAHLAGPLLDESRARIDVFVGGVLGGGRDLFVQLLFGTHRRDVAGDWRSRVGRRWSGRSGVGLLRG